MYFIFKKSVAEGKGKKLSRQSICNICSVCNHNVSNDCTVANVPSDISVVSNCKYCR